MATQLGTAVYEDELEAGEKAVRSIWGGLEGDVYIVSPMLADADEWEQRMQHLRTHGDGVGVRVEELPSAGQTTPVIQALRDNWGRIQFEGDAVAQHMVSLVLAQLFPARSQHLRFAQDLSPDGEEYARVRASNIVAICGPRANPMSEEILRALGRRDLFASGWGLRRMRPLEGDEYHRYDGKVDYGVAIKAPNPFPGGVGKSVYVLAGCRQYGTQAAAASLVILPLAACLLGSAHWDAERFELRCVARRPDGVALSAPGTDLEVKIIEPCETRWARNPREQLQAVDRLRWDDSGEAAVRAYEERYGDTPADVFSRFNELPE
jgi:hypothetical protein